MILDKKVYIQKNIFQSFLGILKMFFVELFFILRKKSFTPMFSDASMIRGIPKLQEGRDCSFCDVCVEVCPTFALEIKDKGLILNVEKCIYCQDCVWFCPDDVLYTSFENSFASHGENEDFSLNLFKVETRK